MIAQVAHAEGAPCPTLVLADDQFPADLLPLLTAVRGWLADSGYADVLKIAVVARSAHPLFDLDYRFVQCLPGEPARFDFQGSCGHSMIASTLVASAAGLAPRLVRGSRTRLRDRGNGGTVVCQTDRAATETGGDFTLYNVCEPALPPQSLLLTGNAVDRVAGHDVSLVSFGNPYVFVDAASIGIADAPALFAAGDAVFGALEGIRRAAATLLRTGTSSVFPKIAAIGGYTPGRLCARAISVPGWHPALGLTGVTCVAAAVGVPDTIPARLFGGDPALIPIDTPGGCVRAAVRTAGSALGWVSVSGKRARVLSGPCDLGPAGGELLREKTQCLQRTL